MKLVLEIGEALDGKKVRALPNDNGSGNRKKRTDELEIHRDPPLATTDESQCT